MDRKGDSAASEEEDEGLDDYYDEQHFRKGVDYHDSHQY
jgi:hypothetical protein